VGIAHWDDVEAGHDIGRAAGALNVTLRRVRLSSGETASQSDPAAEEIVFVVEGSGTWDHDGGTTNVRAHDCIVRLVHQEGHVLRGADEGLTAFSFTSPVARRPFAGANGGPPNVVNLDTIEADYEGDVGKWVLVAREAGAERAGLNWGRLEAGRSGAAPHCHSADEEVFVILAGAGTLELWPAPQEGADTHPEQHELKAGDVVWRPPSTTISHFFRAASPAGMTFLAYGTREPNDVCYYPRSNKIYWRGVGLISRLEPVGYDEREPED
jgi:uncharacterized cupin superfamily protein